MDRTMRPALLHGANHRVPVKVHDGVLGRPRPRPEGGWMPGVLTVGPVGLGVIGLLDPRVNLRLDGVQGLDGRPASWLHFLEGNAQGLRYFSTAQPLICPLQELQRVAISLRLPERELRGETPPLDLVFRHREQRAVRQPTRARVGRDPPVAVSEKDRGRQERHERILDGLMGIFDQMKAIGDLDFLAFGRASHLCRCIWTLFASQCPTAFVFHLR